MLQDPAANTAKLNKNGGKMAKIKSKLAEELRKSLSQGSFQIPVTARTNKFGQVSLSSSTAPGESNTPAQDAWRLKYAACVVEWNEKTPEEKAAYQEDADKREITAFNQFMSVCLLYVPPARKLYERYNLGDVAQADMFDKNWRAQTFTIGNTGPNEDHIVTSVILKLLRYGLPGTVTVTINEADSDLPTGVILATGTTDGNTLTTSYPYGWREIFFVTPAGLSASTQYAIVVDARDGNSSNLIRWRTVVPPKEYTGGQHSFSSDSGSNWTIRTGRDLMFEEWGEAI